MLGKAGDPQDRQPHQPDRRRYRIWTWASEHVSGVMPAGLSSFAALLPRQLVAACPVRIAELEALPRLGVIEPPPRQIRQCLGRLAQCLRVTASALTSPRSAATQPAPAHQPSMRSEPRHRLGLRQL